MVLLQHSRIIKITDSMVIEATYRPNSHIYRLRDQYTVASKIAIRALRYGSVRNNITAICSASTVRYFTATLTVCKRSDNYTIVFTALVEHFMVLEHAEQGIWRKHHVVVEPQIEIIIVRLCRLVPCEAHTLAPKQFPRSLNNIDLRICRLDLLSRFIGRSIIHKPDVK